MSTTIDDQRTSIERHSQVKTSGQSFNIYGIEDKTSGGIVLHQVFVNCKIGRPDRSTVHALPIQEIPLMRRLQKMNGGEVKPLATWVDTIHVRQVRGLTRAQAGELLERLKGQTDITLGQSKRAAYVHTMDDGTDVNIFEAVYGGQNGQPNRLFKAMKEAKLKWDEVNTEARDQMRRLTEEDIESVIECCMPQDDLKELSELDELEDDVLATGNAPVSDDKGLIEFLVEGHGVHQDVATLFAQALHRNNGTLTAEHWDAIPGLSSMDKASDKKRAKLMTLYKEFETL
jgi:hypothetical protein